MTLLTVEETLKKGAQGIKECFDGCYHEGSGRFHVHDGTPCPHCGGYVWCVAGYATKFCFESGTYDYEIQGAKIKVKCVCSQNSDCKKCEGSGEYVHTFPVDLGEGEEDVLTFITKEI